MAERYTNIRVILDKLLRNPLLQDLNLETAIDYTVDFMRIVGTPAIFENKIAIIDIENYRGDLPEDYYQMIQVRNAEDKIVARHTTDTFHLSENKSTLPNELTPFTYKIQGNVIYSSMEKGKLEISYEAILLDEDNIPLIPDNSSFTRALGWYIKKEWYTILFEQGKISQQVLYNTQQEYAWSVGDCQTEFNRLSIDKAESLANMWKSFIARDNEHSYGFKHTGSRQLIKVK